jgi:hypothetical protein
MFVTALAWAMAQPAESRARALADAYTAGVTKVTYDGKSLDYFSVSGLERAISTLYAVNLPASHRRPGVTIARLGGGF